MTKFVFDFTEGDKDQKDLLGGKGANLAEMTKLGLPVPPGFTITTEACREYLSRGAMAFHFPDCPTCAEGPHNLCDPDEDEPDFSGDREHHDGADRPDKRQTAAITVRIPTNTYQPRSGSAGTSIANAVAVTPWNMNPTPIHMASIHTAAPLLKSRKAK